MDIITYNFKKLLKNKIFLKIPGISEEIINSIVDHLFDVDDSHVNYF